MSERSANEWFGRPGETSAGGWFGRPVNRKEDPALLRGEGRYVDDIELPGMLHAAFVRSPYAHAKVGRIDKSAALDVPGVHAVLTYADLPESVRSRTLPLLVPHPRSSSLSCRTRS